MNKVKAFALLLILSISLKIEAQQAVVNQYFNAADPRDEWIELLVTADNVDMRNWTLRDNNSTQTAWQGSVQFTNNALWNNLRAGTLIIIWNRIVASDGVTNHTTDVSKADGYIEINAQNTTYFTLTSGPGVTFGTTPTWGGAALNFAGNGDVIELLDGSGTHVHALGHCSPAGAQWTALATPKLNHNNTASSGDAIYVCPGRSLAYYNGPATGNNYTSKNNASLTFGLPNTCGSSATGNSIFTDSLREPIIAAQTVTPTTSVPGNITFSWAAATDPNSADNTTGYLILSNTSNSFTAPADGTTYATGSTLGTATVLAILNSSTIVSYTDNTVVSGNSYYYRVYAFRYGTDDLNGNTYNSSRGRAYNQTNFVVVNSIAPLPIELLSFTAIQSENEVRLNWATASELNNDYFTIERSADAQDFISIAKIKGGGSIDHQSDYQCYDEDPLKGINYYRLTQTDFNGTTTNSEMVAITFSTANESECIFPNPTSDKVNIILTACENAPLSVEIINNLGQFILLPIKLNGDRSVNVEQLAPGIYILLVHSGDQTYANQFIKN